MIFDERGLPQHLVAIQRRRDHVGTHDVLEAEGVEGGLDVAELERLHVGGMIEHRRQLSGETVELLVGQIEQRQTGHVGHIGTGEAGGAGLGHGGQDKPAACGPGPLPAGTVDPMPDAPARHPFLSPEWIAAARLIRDEYVDRVESPPMSMRANVVVTGAPFGDGEVHGHLDTSNGAAIVEDGHLTDPQLTVTVPYEVARAVFMDRDAATFMRAFMEGKIKVLGDASKLLAIQPPPPDGDGAELAREIAARLDAITAPAA